jgi:hypothetical protein
MWVSGRMPKRRLDGGLAIGAIASILPLDGILPFYRFEINIKIFSPDGSASLPPSLPAPPRTSRLNQNTTMVLPTKLLNPLLSEKSVN